MKKKIVLSLLLVLITWIIMDLLRPVHKDIRQFDPQLVARLDTEMWRSYYDKKALKLFLQLGELLRKQFNIPFWRSQVIAFHAARAAFVFKKGKERAAYEKALPSLKKYYTALQKISTTKFDIQEAARLELEWWIVHRQRAQQQEGNLEKALAESAAVIYQIHPEKLQTYARYRTEAMDIRDEQAQGDGVSEAEWKQIAGLLDQCWEALYRSVNK
jgi:hypothetical protein